MKKNIALLFVILLIPKVSAYDYKDCEVFVLPKLGITDYQTCLQNPNAYESYFIYHDVSFYDGGTLLKTSSVREGSDAIPPTSPSKIGYDFAGWDKSYTDIRSTKSIYSKYELKEYTVTFKDYDGSTLKTEYVNHGGDALAPVANREGYVFTSWSGSYKNVQNSVTLVAQYLRPEYEVVFYGFGNQLLKIVDVPLGSNAKPPTAPVINGYDFTGWIGNYNNITTDKSIYADYERITHNVKYVSEGIVVKEVQVVDGGSALPPSNPTKQGYTFIGWDASYNNITANKTINALYQIKSYQVVYHGLDKILKTEIVNYNQDSTPPSDYVEEGYDFLGWTGNYENVNSNLDIYANYSRKTYTIVLKDYDGITIDTISIQHGESLIVDDPMRVGYDFTGWSDSISNITKDMTLIAQYKAKL